MGAIGIECFGYSLGTDTLTNEDIQILKPEWPMEDLAVRTGVYERPIAVQRETALDLAERAVHVVDHATGRSVDDIDALIFCTQTPDYILPPNSTLLHGRLGLPQSVMAFDIAHACSGFIYGLGIARSLVMSAAANRVLLVNADTYTRLLHEDDRSTRGIFGDGASAAIISCAKPILAILDCCYGTDGNHYSKFIVRQGGAREPNMEPRDAQLESTSNRASRNPAYIEMDGLGLLSFFNNVLPKAIKDLLGKNDLTLNDVDHFVFHQASALALQGLERSLGISSDRVVNKMRTTGNLVSASIPVALSLASDDGEFQNGDLMVLAGFGVGLSWGVSLVRWMGDGDLRKIG